MTDHRPDNDFLRKEPRAEHRPMAFRHLGTRIGPICHKRCDKIKERGESSARPCHQASLTYLLPGAIQRPDVCTTAAGSLQALHPPIPGGFPKLEEVRRLQMGLEGGLVFVYLVEPDAIGIMGVLDHVKAETSRLIDDSTSTGSTSNRRRLTYLCIPDGSPSFVEPGTSQGRGPVPNDPAQVQVTDVAHMRLP